MRILILALTLGLGLTLNAKEENGITKKDSIHFIDGVLIMANDTISLNEFYFFAKHRYERATVRYIKRAKKEMFYVENTEMAKKDKAKRIRSLGAAGVLYGAAGVASGTLLLSATDVRGGGFSGIIGAIQAVIGGGLVVGGATIAAISLGGAAIGSAKNKTAPLMSSAYYNLEANRLIDKAVNSYNKQNGPTLSKRDWGWVLVGGLLLSP